MAVVLDCLPVRQKKKFNEAEKDSSFGRGARAWPEGVFKVTPEMVIWWEMRAGQPPLRRDDEGGSLQLNSKYYTPRTKMHPE